LPADQHAELIRAHGLDNVAFGTDWPWMDQAAELETLRGLGLTDDEFRQVTEHPAAAWLGL
ncbi:MAG: amidohydrolase family protein, partial [Phycisphaerales bacterium]|nr:amidohydrolase family protein [Phycisphaerales bacterium]